LATRRSSQLSYYRIDNILLKLSIKEINFYQ